MLFTVITMSVTCISRSACILQFALTVVRVTWWLWVLSMVIPGYSVRIGALKPRADWMSAILGSRIMIVPIAAPITVVTASPS